MREEGLSNIFRRHDASCARPHAQRCATWGLEIVCEEPLEYSNAHDGDFYARTAMTRTDCERLFWKIFDMSLGAGLGKLAGKVFRSGIWAVLMTSCWRER